MKTRKQNKEPLYSSSLRLKNLLAATITLCLFAGNVMAGNAEFNKDARSALRTEPYIGLTGSFAFGKYIAYQKSYFDVSSPNTEIKGKILPNAFFSIGVKQRWIPFSDDLLSNLSISLGLGYFQRGFTSSYKAVYTDPDRNRTDKTVFTESYRINQLSIPVHIRWGKKWYGEIGFTVNPFLTAFRWHKVKHNATGSDAYEGGYNESTFNRTQLQSYLFKRRTASFDLAGGIDLPKNVGFRLQCSYIRKAFNSSPNMSNILLDLQLVYHINFTKKNKATQ